MAIDQITEIRQTFRELLTIRYLLSSIFLPLSLRVGVSHHLFLIPRCCLELIIPFYINLSVLLSNHTLTVGLTEALCLITDKNKQRVFGKTQLYSHYTSLYTNQLRAGGWQHVKKYNNKFIYIIKITRNKLFHADLIWSCFHCCCALLLHDVTKDAVDDPDPIPSAAPSSARPDQLYDLKIIIIIWPKRHQQSDIIRCMYCPSDEHLRLRTPHGPSTT